MAQNKQALKSRIKSIKTTRKITSAMELIANAKLMKERSVMEKNREYASTIKETIANILSSVRDVENELLKDNNSNKTFAIIFSSDLGLCGAYNANVNKLVRTNLSKDDELVVIGSKLYNHLKKEGYNVINEQIASDGLTYETIMKLVNQGIDSFKAKNVGKICIYYTKFINTVSFEATCEKILPYEKNLDGSYQEMMFDPSVDEVLDSLIVQALHSITYAFALETKVSEQASRRSAMENANDNAEELEEKLVLAYNQARQASITQEITEIVSGADAL